MRGSSRKGAGSVGVMPFSNVASAVQHYRRGISNAKETELSH